MLVTRTCKCGVADATRLIQRLSVLPLTSPTGSSAGTTPTSHSFLYTARHNRHNTPKLARCVLSWKPRMIEGTSPAAVYLQHLEEKRSVEVSLPVWKQRQLQREQQAHPMNIGRAPRHPFLKPTSFLEKVPEGSSSTHSTYASSSASDGVDSNRSLTESVESFEPTPMPHEPTAFANELVPFVHEDEALLDEVLHIDGFMNDEDSFMALERLIDETADRWRSSSSLEARRDSASSAEEIIRRQQEEIEELRRQLERTDVMEPLEQIDVAPIEHIEVALDDHSVTSGLTNLHTDANRFLDDHSLIMDMPISRPDADSVAGDCQEQRTVPLALRAGDGSIQQGLYTGPIINGECSGMGTIKFNETGDTYMGEVLNGEMHGKGTYTFRHRRRRTPFKVLRGMFEHNVFTGVELSAEAVGQ